MMDNNINWLEPWGVLCTEPVSFEKELYKEVGKQHVLFLKKVNAIGFLSELKERIERNYEK